MLDPNRQPYREYSHTRALRNPKSQSLVEFLKDFGAALITLVQFLKPLTCIYQRFQRFQTYILIRVRWDNKLVAGRCALELNEVIIAPIGSEECATMLKVFSLPIVYEFASSIFASEPADARECV